MSLDPNSKRVAVIGSGLAGAACVAGLRSTNARVTLFGKSRNVGGRMATRCVGWVDASGAEQAVTFDHGAQCFAPDRPRFKAAMARAMAANCLGEWLPRVDPAWPAAHGQCLVASPTMPVLCSAWVLRNDRMPRRIAPPGLAVRTAHTTAEWSAAHLEDGPQSVNAELQSALMAQLPATSGGGQPVQWHHAAVHRWRYAGPAFGRDDSFDSDEAWWNDSLGLGGPR